MEIGGSLRGRWAGIDAEECTVAPRSQLCRSGRRSCRTEMGAPGGCPQEPVRAGVGHGRAGRGLGRGGVVPTLQVSIDGDLGVGTPEKA